VLWRCWLGSRKGIWPAKKTEWWDAGVVICLERGADLHIVQLMSLPLTVSCFSKIQIGLTFLVPAHRGSPGQRAVRRARVCVCVTHQKHAAMCPETPYRLYLLFRRRWPLRDRLLATDGPERCITPLSVLGTCTNVILRDHIHWRTAVVMEVTVSTNHELAHCTKREWQCQLYRYLQPRPLFSSYWCLGDKFFITWSELRRV